MSIGRFGGARLSDFLSMVGADRGARFLTMTCADDYYESLDMETALHPQSLLCYEMYDRPLDRGHGAPLRLNLPTKLRLQAGEVPHDARRDPRAARARGATGATRGTAGMADSDETTEAPRPARSTNTRGRCASSLGQRRDGDGAGDERTADLLAFPSFGAKIPQENLIDEIPRRWRSAAGWAARCSGTSPSCGSSPARACSTSMSQILSGHYRTVLFMPRECRRLADGPPLLPVRAKAAATGQYNPLQKLAYTTALLFGMLSLLTGLVMYKPVQFSTLGSSSAAITARA